MGSMSRDRNYLITLDDRAALRVDYQGNQGRSLRTLHSSLRDIPARTPAHFDPHIPVEEVARSILILRDSSNSLAGILSSGLSPDLPTSSQLESKGKGSSLLYHPYHLMCEAEAASLR